jgi:hypothetical protein
MYLHHLPCYDNDLNTLVDLRDRTRLPLTLKAQRPRNEGLNAGDKGKGGKKILNRLPKEAQAMLISRSQLVQGPLFKSGLHAGNSWRSSDASTMLICELLGWTYNISDCRVGSHTSVNWIRVSF